MSYILSYLKKSVILTLATIIIVVLVYVIKNQLTLHNIGYGLSIGGIATCVIGGLALLGSGQGLQRDAQNTYITGYDAEKYGVDYIKEKSKNTNFTLLLLISGLISLIIGYIIS